MAILPDADRKEVWQKIMRDLSQDGEEIGVTKPQLRDAVDAIDQYMDDNVTAINNSLPAPAKANLTAGQKALLLSYVVLKRYEVI